MYYNIKIYKIFQNKRKFSHYIWKITHLQEEFKYVFSLINYFDVICMNYFKFCAPSEGGEII